MSIEQRLTELEIILPEVPMPVANYIGHRRVGSLLFIGGNIGQINGKLDYVGRVGDEVSASEAYSMARNCGLNHLSVMQSVLGTLDSVQQIVKVTGYINAAAEFVDLPSVLNGESDLMVSVFEERGRHARAAIGVATLSENAPVETEIIVDVGEEGL